MSANRSRQRQQARGPARPAGREGKRPAPRAPQPVTDTREPEVRGWFGPLHLFAVASVVAAAGSALATGVEAPVNTVFVSLAFCAVGFAAYLLYRAVYPLVTRSVVGPDMVGGRTRVALEREKTALLRAIKELEFDRAMGKVSEGDFRDMSDRLRARAVRLIKQLDTGRAGYRELIERELAARRTAIDSRQKAGGAPATVAEPIETPLAAVEPETEPEPEPIPDWRCGRCGTVNDPDAQFCKRCGNKLTSPL